MDISTGRLKSHIHTWIYSWISISTANLHNIQISCSKFTTLFLVAWRSW